MAKITFYEISCGSYEIEGKQTVVDSLKIQISKNVCRPTMVGYKAETYSIPVSEISYLFNAPDFNPPKMVGEDATKRIDYIREFINGYLNCNVYAEEITKGNRKILTALEFRE